MNVREGDEFGRALRRIAMERFGGQARLARAMGVSPSWIAMVVQGRQVGLSYAGLEKLLGGVGDLRDQELLYQAWAATYAPSPLLGWAPTKASPNARVEEYANSAGERVAAGGVLCVYRTLSELWRDLRGDERRCGCAFVVGSALVETAHHLSRVALAWEVAEELLAMAVRANDPFWSSRALSLKGTTLRQMKPGRELEAEETFRRLADFLSSWTPQTKTERERREGLVRVATRDKTLAACDIVSHGSGGGSVLEKRVHALGRIGDATDDAGEDRIHTPSAKAVIGHGGGTTGNLHVLHPHLPIVTIHGRARGRSLPHPHPVRAVQIAHHRTGSSIRRHAVQSVPRIGLGTFA